MPIRSGAVALDGDAVVEEVLIGKEFYKDSPTNKLTGTLRALDGSLVVSNVLKYSNDAESECNLLAWTKEKEIDLNSVKGTLRIKFDLKQGDASRIARGWIYKNGVAEGTERQNSSETYIEYSEDIAGWVVDDLLQLYLKSNDVTPGMGAWCRNLRIYGDWNVPLIWVEPNNTME